MEPKLLIADGPVPVLGVTVQASILALLGEPRTERGLAMLRITQNLPVVAQVCDRLAVMQTGRGYRPGRRRMCLRD